jgi:hypothetical protein
MSLEKQLMAAGTAGLITAVIFYVLGLIAGSWVLTTFGSFGYPVWAGLSAAVGSFFGIISAKL